MLTKARCTRIALVLAGLGGVSYLLVQVGPGPVWAAFRVLGWRLPIVLVGPFSLALVLDALGWQVLLRGRGIPLRTLLWARLAGEAVNLITPSASVGGDPLKAYLVRTYVPVSEGLASVIADKTSTVASQVLFLFGGFCLSARILPLSDPLMRGMAAILALEIVAVTGFIVVQVLGAFGRGGRILGRLGLHLDRIHATLDALDDSLARFYRHGRGTMLTSSLLHGAAWATGALEIYLFLDFVEVDASLSVALIIEAFASGVKFASFMIPASLGVLEGGYVVIFRALGLGGSLGLSYGLVRRLRETLCAIVGLLCVATLQLRPSLAEHGTVRGTEMLQGGP